MTPALRQSVRLPDPSQGAGIRALRKVLSTPAGVLMSSRLLHDILTSNSDPPKNAELLGLIERQMGIRPVDRSAGRSDQKSEVVTVSIVRSIGIDKPTH